MMTQNITNNNNQNNNNNNQIMDIDDENDDDDIELPIMTQGKGKDIAVISAGGGGKGVSRYDGETTESDDEEEEEKQMQIEKPANKPVVVEELHNMVFVKDCDGKDVATSEEEPTSSPEAKDTGLLGLKQKKWYVPQEDEDAHEFMHFMQTDGFWRPFIKPLALIAMISDVFDSCINDFLQWLRQSRNIPLAGNLPKKHIFCNFFLHNFCHKINAKN